MTTEEITQKMDCLERIELYFIFPIIVLFLGVLISGITTPSAITLILLGLILLLCLPVIVISIKISQLAEQGADLTEKNYQAAYAKTLIDRSPGV